MAANAASSDSSSKDLEKGDLLEQSVTNTREEEEEEEAEEDRAARTARHLRPQLPHVRSHSSARSTRSYTDGYSHFDHDDDEKTKQAADSGTANPDQDREFEVHFDGESDPDSPRNKTKLRKWCIVLIGSTASLCVTFASACYTSTYRQMESDFGIGREVATLGLTTYVCGLGLGPMFLSPLSEFYGRRIIYICAFGMYFIWLIPCAVAQNVQTMLIVRFFDGLAGSAFLSVAGGTVGDMFNKEELSLPMLIYTASPFAGKWIRDSEGPGVEI